MQSVGTKMRIWAGVAFAAMLALSFALFAQAPQAFANEVTAAKGALTARDGAAGLLLQAGGDGASEPIPLELGVPQDVYLASEDDQAVFTFTPDESGVYAFASDFGANPEASLYTEDIPMAYNDNKDENSWDFSIIAELEAGVTYYLACSTIEDGDSYTVTVTRFDVYDLNNYEFSYSNRVFAGSYSEVLEQLAVQFISPIDGEPINNSYSEVFTVTLGTMQWGDYDEGTFQPFEETYEFEGGQFCYAEIRGVGDYAGYLNCVWFDVYSKGDFSYYELKHNEEVPCPITSENELIEALDIGFYAPDGTRWGEYGKDYVIDQWWTWDGSYNSLPQGEYPTEIGEYIASFIGLGDYSDYGFSADFCLVDPSEIDKEHDLARYSSWCDEVLTSDAEDPETLFEALEICYYDDDDDDEIVLEYDTEGVDVTWCSSEWDSVNETYTPLPENPFPLAGGDYVLKLEGSDPYWGTAYIRFSVLGPNNISSDEFSCTVGEVYATGSPIGYDDLGITLYEGDDEDGTPLTAGTDYEYAGWFDYDETILDYVSISAPTVSGGYYVKLVGKNGYSGSRYVYVYVRDSNNISNYVVHCGNDWFYDTDGPVSFSDLQFVAYRGDDSSVRLTSNDYTIGEWKKGTGEYYEDDDDEWREYEYVGEGASFKVTEPGDYRVQLVGKAPYSGSLYVYFFVRDGYRISNYNDGTEIPQLIEYTGQPVTASDMDTSRLYRFDRLGNQVMLPASAYRSTGEFYDESFDYDEDDVPLESAPVEPGVYYLRYEAVAPYTGDFYYCFEIVPSGSLKLAVIEGIEDEYVYTGEDIVVPTPTVTLGTQELDLSENGDYTWALQKEVYLDPDDDEPVYVDVESKTITEMGDYVVTIASKSDPENYVRWEIWVHRPIEPTPLEGNFYIEGVAELYPVTGSAIKPAITVRSKREYDVVLYEGSDYTVTYVNNVNAGTAMVMVKGINNYKGTLAQAFVITGQSPEPTVTPTPTPKPVPQVAPKAAAVGTTLSVSASVFKVSKSGSAPEVAFTKAKAAKTVSVPATIAVGGVTYKVTSIANNAFKGNNKVASVTVGDNVAAIGKSAFQNCKKLKKLVIGKNVKRIGKNAFKGAKNLKKVTIKSGKLNKASIKNLLRGSKIKTIILSGKAAKAKKAAYQKFAGKNVKVK